MDPYIHIQIVKPKFILHLSLCFKFLTVLSLGPGFTKAIYLAINLKRANLILNLNFKFLFCFQPLNQNISQPVLAQIKTFSFWRKNLPLMSHIGSVTF